MDIHPLVAAALFRPSFGALERAEVKLKAVSAAG